MWKFFKTKRDKEYDDLASQLRNYFSGDGMDKLAKLQGKYMMEEQFKQMELKRKNDAEIKYTFLKAKLDSGKQLSYEETKELEWLGFLVNGKIS